MSYKRIIIKLSGEGLSNKENNLSIDFDVVKNIANQIKAIQEKGIQIGIIIGGGNFWRGLSATKNGVPRIKADYIGMLATIMNALALQSAFEDHGVPTQVQSSISVDLKIAESYRTEKAIEYFKQGQVVIFAGGIGRPFFTTDTTSVLVASEINADVIFMGKNGVDGIYNADPKINENAKHIDVITYDELLKQKLTVMDTTAVALAKDNEISLVVFDIKKPNSLLNIIVNKTKHTKVIK